MGAECSTNICREDGLESGPAPSVLRTSGGAGAGGAGGSGAARASKAKEKEKDFWHEKMRFSQSSQTLFSAAVKGDAALAASAVRSLGDPNCCSGSGYRPLQVAVSLGHRELVDLLLKAGADINGHSKGTPPPIVLAAGNIDDRDGRLFEELLGQGADLSVAEELSGETALSRAADRGQTAIVQIVLSRGSPGFQKLLAQRARTGPEGDGATPLHLAASRGYRGICDRLLGAGADPSARDRLGRMPLHRATEGDHVEVANLLLSFGSLHSGQDPEGLTPLHVASAKGFLTMADLLVRFGADASAKSRAGQTALHLAAAAGHDIICQLLLAQGTDPSTADASGETPFSLAFAQAHVRCCRVLVDNGADVRAVDTQRWVPPYTDFDPGEHERLRRGRPGAGASALRPPPPG